MTKKQETKQLRQEVNSAQEPVFSDEIKDIPRLLACILRELESNHKYLEFLAKLEATRAGIEV